MYTSVYSKIFLSTSFKLELEFFFEIVSRSYANYIKKWKKVKWSVLNFWPDFPIETFIKIIYNYEFNLRYIIRRAQMKAGGKAKTCQTVKSVFFRKIFLTKVLFQLQAQLPLTQCLRTLEFYRIEPKQLYWEIQSLKIKLRAEISFQKCLSVQMWV